MLGFSVYLGRDLTAIDYNYLITMRNAGFDTIFTSLQIPEEDPSKVLARLKELTKWCQNLDLEVLADVSEDSLKNMGVDVADVGQVQALNLTGLRIDDGIAMNIVAKLSKSMPIALNASTITDEQLTQLKEYNAAFSHLQAWHNFYPRPETGLDSQWFKEKNDWLKQYDFEIAAFVPGDGELRGPIFAGLPTLEKHRYQNPLADALELKQLGCDHVFIGDASLKSSTIDSFTNYLKKNAITLHLDEDVEELTTNTWHNHPDAARDMIRLVESRSRQLFNIEPIAAVSRPMGSVTCDNDKYLRYKGEVEITKRDLPADEKVNVLTHINPEDLQLLNYVDSGRQIIFVKKEDESE